MAIQTLDFDTTNFTSRREFRHAIRALVTQAAMLTGGREGLTEEDIDDAFAAMVEVGGKIAALASAARQVGPTEDKTGVPDVMSVEQQIVEFMEEVNA